MMYLLGIQLAKKGKNRLSLPWKKAARYHEAYHAEAKSTAAALGEGRVCWTCVFCSFQRELEPVPTPAV